MVKVYVKINLQNTFSTKIPNDKKALGYGSITSVFRFLERHKITLHLAIDDISISTKYKISLFSVRLGVVLHLRKPMLGEVS